MWRAWGHHLRQGVGRRGLDVTVGFVGGARGMRRVNDLGTVCIMFGGTEGKAGADEEAGEKER